MKFNKLIREKIKSYYIDLAKGKGKGALDALFSFLLLLLSFAYGFAVRLMRSLYQCQIFKSYKANCRVISVGNITWGGTGKTPLVAALAKQLKQQGKKPAVLIRGYGQDEIYMLQNKLKDIPILPGRDRIKTAKAAQEKYGANVIILDDGFQHWRLERDLDIVLIDASSPFGNKRMIPAGILREPLSSLSRADTFVLTRADAADSLAMLKQKLKSYNPQAQVYEAVHTASSVTDLRSDEMRELSSLSARRIAAVCAIANPDSFGKTLDSLGAEVAWKFYFTDHHQYTNEDLEQIEKQCLDKGIKTAVITEKDAPKIAPLLKSRQAPIQWLVLGVEVKIINDQDKFFQDVTGEVNLASNYSVLILSDGKAGHLRQSQAVAEIIKRRKLDQGLVQDRIKIKVQEVKFKNRFLRFLLEICSLFSSVHCRGCLSCLRFCLTKKSFNELLALPCDVVVSAGSSLAAVNFYIACKMRARKVILMNPSFLNLDKFDLAIIPEHDKISLNDNIVVTKVTPNLINEQYLKEQKNALTANFELSPDNSEGPTIGVLFGGDSPKYKIDKQLTSLVSVGVKQAVENLDGRLLFTTSRRTSSEAEEVLRQSFNNFNRCKLLIIANQKNVPEAVGGILALSDIVLVSAESISMVSESLASGKYVLVFMPKKKTKAKTRQDKFLEHLQQDGLVKVVEPERIACEIERLWKERPARKTIEDQSVIYQALSKIL